MVTGIEVKQYIIPARKDGSGLVTRESESVRAAEIKFQPNQLAVFDSNTPPSLLGFDSALSRLGTKIFENPQGTTAHQVLKSGLYPEALAVAGGIYYFENGPESKAADAFLYYHPTEKNSGVLISPVNDDYLSGGYLMIDFGGVVTLVRKDDFEYDEEDIENSNDDDSITDQICLAANPFCFSLNDYRLIVQSNVILVADGQEDHNKEVESEAAPRSALVAYADGLMGLVSVEEDITLAQFGDLLVLMGAWQAINLDGGPSLQLAEKTAEGKIKKVMGWSGIFGSPDTMPQFFVVQNSHDLSYDGSAKN